MIHLNHYQHVFASKTRQAWIGKTPPAGVTAIDLRNSPALRAPAEYHNSFDLVWLFEDILSEMPVSQWTLFVDEAIRLLDESGTLIVRYRQDDAVSLMKVRSLIGRRPGISVRMDPHQIEHDIVNDVFHIERHELLEYRNKSWSFVMLAQGSRTPTVVSFLNKLRDIGDDYTCETIIVGPRLPEYDRFDVRVLDREYRSDLAQIALKKNDAVRYAMNSNLCIMHDRFVLNNDFFEGFEEFGYDFDFVAIRQRYGTGEPYPFYGELSGSPMVWSVPYHSMNYQHVRPTHFVNGGLMIFKRTMFQRIPFNALLGWNEAEDVELSHTFLSRGIPPRINLSSSASTTVSTAHTAMFLADPSVSAAE